MNIQRGYLDLSGGVVPVMSPTADSPQSVVLSKSSQFLNSPQAVATFNKVYAEEVIKHPETALATAQTMANLYFQNTKLPVASPATLGQHMEAVRSAIMSVNPQGSKDVVALLATTPTLLAPQVNVFVQQPIIKGTLYLLSKWRAPVVVPSTQTLQMVFLAIADNESDLNVAAKSSDPKSSASGALQIIRRTYYSALDQIHNSAFSEFGSAIATVQNYMLKAASQSMMIVGKNQTASASSLWKPFNHDSPAFDLNGPEAYVGVMRDSVLNVQAEWTWTGNQYYPRQLGGTNQLFFNKFKSLLKDKEAGFCALVSYYHVNGGNANNAKLAYTSSRYEEDARTFNELRAAAGLTRLLASSVSDVAVHSASTYGDVIANASNVDAWNADVIEDSSVTIKVIKPRGAPYITSNYNPKRKINKKVGINHTGHFGLDLRAQVGTPVFSPCDGYVSSIYFKTGTGWGHSVVITSNSNTQYRFAHLSKILLKESNVVRKGQIVALTGKSGTINPHLHLEVTLPKVGRIDPTKDPDKGWTMVL